jgi:nucleoid DNA-binding protein
LLQKVENMEISQHIKNLLKTNNRVILKNFGAFDTKHIPAVVDKETKVMKPPFKIVVFVPDIKEDAGLLLKYIAEQERISLDNANEQIDEYVRALKLKLEEGQTVDCKDLGNFKKSIEGSYEFSFLSEENLLLDSYGLPSVSLSDQDKISTRTEVKTMPEKQITETNKTEQKVVTQPEKKVPEVKQQPIKQQPVKQTVKQQPVKEKPVKDVTLGDKPKKKKGWLILLIIVGVIGVGMAAVYFLKPEYWDKGVEFSSSKFNVVKSTVGGWFNKNDDKYKIIEKIDKTDTNKLTEVIKDTSTVIENNTTVENQNDTENVTTDETVVNTNETDNNNTENLVENNTITPSSTGRYYIIIGSLETESQAQKEQKRFSNKGIKTDIIHVPNINRYRLSAGAFNTPKEAQDYFAQLQKKSAGLEGWVWEKK